MNNTILAIDLGKYKSVACVHDEATGEIRFRLVCNTVPLAREALHAPNTSG